MYDAFSTHLPALAQAVLRYGPRVLEIGCGWYSTPLLHAMSSQVITLESNAEWIEKFIPLARRGQIQFAPNMFKAVEQWAVHRWDVVFVDCEPVSDRVPCVELFLNRRCCVVAHDTEVDNYKDILPTIRYVKHFDFIMPRTSHLSNVLDVTL